MWMMLQISWQTGCVPLPTLTWINHAQLPVSPQINNTLFQILSWIIPTPQFWFIFCRKKCTGYFKKIQCSEIGFYVPRFCTRFCQSHQNIYKNDDTFFWNIHLCFVSSSSQLHTCKCTIIYGKISIISVCSCSSEWHAYYCCWYDSRQHMHL